MLSDGFDFKALSNNLIHHCNDPRLVAWFCEGLAHKYELEGIAFGLNGCEAIQRPQMIRLRFLPIPMGAVH